MNTACGIRYDEDGYCVTCGWDEYSHSNAPEWTGRD
jgi:hypothetical protein